MQILGIGEHLHDLAQTERWRHHCKRIVVQLMHRHLAATRGEGMPGTHQQDHGLRGRGDVLDLRMRWWIVGEANMRAALGDFLLHVVDRQDVYGHF